MRRHNAREQKGVRRERGAGGVRRVGRPYFTHPHRTGAMIHKTGDEIVREAKGRIREVQPGDVKAMLARGDDNVYLDVREPGEYDTGHLPGAVHVPRGSLELRVEAIVPREAKVVVYCSAGLRSAMAADTLQTMGYTDVVSMSGGFHEYLPTGGPVEG